MSRTKKLLVVEDEGLVALDLKDRLEELGYSVPAIVDNMDDALAAASKDKVDLALMDIRIKGEHDGVETAERLGREFDIPTIFVTAYSDVATLERAKLAEPFGYIVKPFVHVDFRAQIETVLWKHEMEGKLRQSEAWLSAVVQNVGDAVIATDAGGKIAAINLPALELTGFEAHEAIGQPLLEVFNAFDHETGLPLLTPLEKLYQGEELRCEAQTLLLKDRSQDVFRLIEARISPNVECDKLLGVIVAFKDITEQSQAQTRERQFERMRTASALAAGVGQELRELLDKIASVVASGGHAEMPGWLQRAQSIAEQLEQLQNEEPPTHKAIELNQVLEKLKPKFAEIFEGKRQLVYSLQDKLPPIEAETKRLRKILVETMSELHSLTRRRGNIKISTKASPDWNQVVLSIEDLGKPPKPGTPEATERWRGAGPVLARVHYYTAVAGGELHVTNRSRNGIEWSTLTFVFPVAATSLRVLGERNTSERSLKAS